MYLKGQMRAIPVKILKEKELFKSISVNVLHEISGFFIGSLVTISSLHVRDEVGDIISQLRSGSGGTIFVFKHTIIKLLKEIH